MGLESDYWSMSFLNRSPIVGSTVALALLHTLLSNPWQGSARLQWISVV
jgi:hypothetical protein